MRDELLPSIPELQRQAEENFGTKFNSPEEAFHDAFANGEYHEEAVNFGALAIRLNNNELASLFLPVCKALISGCFENREGEPLKKLMDLFTALGKWQRSRLKNSDDLLSCLDRVRPMVLKLANEEPGWKNIRVYYGTLDIGIRDRMGLDAFHLYSTYD